MVLRWHWERELSRLWCSGALEVKKLLLRNEEIYKSKSICIYKKCLIALQDSELIQNQNCYEPCETEFKMMTDFALEIAFEVFIIQFPNILHFLIILIITELRGTLSWSGLSCDEIQMLWFDTRSSRHSSSSSSTPHSAAAGWLEFLNWIWCLTFESSGSSAVQCTTVLMLNSGVKAPLPYPLSMAMLFAHFCRAFH